MATSFPLHFTLVFLFAIIILGKVDAKILIVNEKNETVHSFVDNEVLNGGDYIPQVRGLIVAADPLDACSPIKEVEFPHFENISIARIVLIFGNLSSSCRPNQKVRNADAARYDVAILFGMPLFISDRYDHDLTITVLSVGYDSGKIIMDNYLYNKSSELFWIEIIPNAEDITYYILLFSVIVGVCIIIMVLFMICLLIKCVQERRRNRRNRLSTREIRQLPTESYSTGGQYETCAICLEEYKVGEKLRILPCSHAYHIKCIDQWLLKNRRTCPLCKRKIKFGESDSEDSSDSELASPAENRPLLPPRSSRTESPDYDSLRQVMRSVVSQLVESGMVHSNEAHNNESRNEAHNNEACSSTSSPFDVYFDPPRPVAEGRSNAARNKESCNEAHNNKACSSSTSSPLDVYFDPPRSVAEGRSNAARQPNPASTYGSVNNSEGEDEFSDALGSRLQNHQPTHMSV